MPGVYIDSSCQVAKWIAEMLDMLRVVQWSTIVLCGLVFVNLLVTLFKKGE